MNLMDRISEELKNAMRARDAARLDAIRALRAEAKKQQDEKPEGFGDADVLRITKMLIKQRQDAVEQFRAGNRQDLVEKDLGQIAVLQEFLPQQLSADEITALVTASIAEAGAIGIRDMGKVMKAASAKVAASGKDIDGRALSEAVKALLQKLG